MSVPSLERFELLLPLETDREADSWLGRATRTKPSSASLDLVFVEQFSGEFLARDDQREQIVENVGRVRNVDHPNLYRTLAAGRLEEQFSVVHEFPVGERLESLLGTAQPEIPEAMRIIADVTGAVAHAHESANVYHGAIHPGIIYVCWDGTTRLGRFGTEEIVRRARHNWGRLNPRQLSYLSPEHCTNDPLALHTDVFNLATVFWELLTGRILFREEDEFERMRVICEQDAPPPTRYNDALPPLLNSLILKALAIEPSERFPDALHMEEVLQGVFSRTQEPAPPNDVADLVRATAKQRFQRWMQLEEARRDGELQSVIEHVAALYGVDPERARLESGSDGLAPSEPTRPRADLPSDAGGTDASDAGELPQKERLAKLREQKPDRPEENAHSEKTRRHDQERHPVARDFEVEEEEEELDAEFDDAFESVSQSDWVEPDSEAKETKETSLSGGVPDEDLEPVDGGVDIPLEDADDEDREAAPTGDLDVDPSPERTEAPTDPVSAQDLVTEDEGSASERTREIDSPDPIGERSEPDEPAEPTRDIDPSDVPDPGEAAEEEFARETSSDDRDDRGARKAEAPEVEDREPDVDGEPAEGETPSDAIGGDLRTMSIDDWLEEEEDQKPYEEPFPLERVIEDRGESEQDRVRQPALEIISIGEEKPLEVSVLRGRQNWSHEGVPVRVQSRGNKARVELQPPSSGWVVRAHTPGQRESLPSPPAEVELRPGDVAEVSDGELTYRFRYFHPPRSPKHISRENAGRTIGTYAVATALAVVLHALAAIALISLHKSFAVSLSVQEEPRKEIFAKGKMKDLKKKEKRQKKPETREPPEPPEPADPAEQEAKVPDEVQDEINEKLQEKRKAAEDKTEAEALAAALSGSDDSEASSVSEAVSNIDAVDSPSGSSSDLEVGGSLEGTEGDKVQVETGGGGESNLGDIGSQIGEGTGDLKAREKDEQVRGTVSSVSSQANVEGRLDRSKVSQTVNQHKGEIQGCYEQQLLKNPGIAGKVTFQWTITRSGSVTGARQKSSTLGNSAVSNCILNIIRRMSFAKPKGGSVTVSYPFMFRSGG